MARKLFALEDMETGDQGEVMEVSPEAGEVADVQVEVEQEATEVAGDVEAIETGVESVDQLEEVGEVIEQAVEEEGGLTPVAAEAIRLAIEAISARVGYNPKAVYALYATENFQSTSSRKANTTIAMEGVMEFLKDLWKKIKTAVNKLIEKVKAFWEKHFSSLGRIKKALESMKTRVSESSGKIKDKAYYDEAPSSLVDAFAGDDDINAALINGFISRHKTATLKGFDKSNNYIEHIKTIIKKDTITDMTEIHETLTNIAQEFSVGSIANDKNNPYIGGIYFEIETEGDDTDSDFSLTLNKEYIDDKESKLGISIADKTTLQSMLKETLVVINETIKLKEKYFKVSEAFNKFGIEVEKFIGKEIPQNQQEAEDIKKDNKVLRTIIKSGYKVMNFATRQNTEMFALNVKLAKAVINYTSFCLKNYKPQV